MDLDRNGKINYSEFIDITIEKKQLLQRKNLEVAFKTLDYNRDGKLTYDELQRTFELGGNVKGEQFWRDFVKQADENQDGCLTLDEFIGMMQKQVSV